MHKNPLILQLQQLKDCTTGGRALTSRALHRAAGPSANNSLASMQTGQEGRARMNAKRQRTNGVEESQDGAAVAESERKVQGEPVTRAPACLVSSPATLHCVYVALCLPSPEARLTVSAATAGEARPVLGARSPSMAHFLRLLAKMNAAPGQYGRV
jgi:hypothetical protein